MLIFCAQLISMPSHGLKTIFKHGLGHSLSCAYLPHICLTFRSFTISLNTRSHDRAFLYALHDAVANYHSIYYTTGMQSQLISCTNTRDGLIITKGTITSFHLSSSDMFSTLTPSRNFTQFYSTKTERDRNLRKEYDTQMDYRKHLQAFIDRWRYNANRGMWDDTIAALMWINI